MALRIATSVAPKVALIRAAVWTLSSVLFLDVACMKVLDLRAEGQEVSGWRYAQTGFWFFMLGFWMYHDWQSLKLFRASRRVV